MGPGEGTRDVIAADESQPGSAAVRLRALDLDENAATRGKQLVGPRHKTTGTPPIPTVGSDPGSVPVIGRARPRSPGPPREPDAVPVTHGLLTRVR